MLGRFFGYGGGPSYENTGLGTDHGRATAMFLLGGGIRGGRVVSRWPGLAHEKLEGPGDLRVTTDFRDILGEVVRDRLKNPSARASNVSRWGKECRSRQSFWSDKRPIRLRTLYFQEQ